MAYPVGLGSVGGPPPPLLPPERHEYLACGQKLCRRPRGIVAQEQNEIFAGKELAAGGN